MYFHMYQRDTYGYMYLRKVVKLIAAHAAGLRYFALDMMVPLAWYDGIGSFKIHFLFKLISFFS